jgi:hypothetical protein
MKIRVTDLLEEVEEERWVRDGRVTLSPSTAGTGHHCGGGGGHRRRDQADLPVAWVHQVITGGQSMNPSTAQLRRGGRGGASAIRW